MTRPIISRELAARELAVTTKALVRYENLGLVRVVHDGDMEGYEPSQVRRLWTIMSFQRDLGQPQLLITNERLRRDGEFSSGEFAGNNGSSHGRSGPVGRSLS